MKKYNRIVLTGASGRLGSYLREPLSKITKKLVSTDKDDIGKTLHNEVFKKLNIKNFKEVNKILKKTDLIIHFGAYSNEGPFQEILDSNILGPYNIWKSAKKNKIKRIIFASSIHSVGMYRANETINHKVMHKPDTFYGLSKCFGENLAQMYWDKCGIECLTIRILSCAKVTSKRSLSTWLSYDDLIRIVIQSTKIKKLGFEIIYGVSNNKRLNVDNTNATRKLNIDIKDNAEKFLNKLKQKLDIKKDKPGDQYLGGPFSIAKLESDAMSSMKIINDKKKIN